MYYVVSIKWSPLDEPDLVFWCGEAKGYTSRLEDAGKYSREEIDAHRSYYDNGTDSKAILCEEVDAVAHRSVLNGYATRQSLGLPKAHKRGRM